MKPWKIFLFSLGLLCQSFACQPPPTQPPVSTTHTTPKPLWSQARAGGGIAYGWFPQFIHNNRLITYKERQSNAIITALDINTGQEIWSWSNLFNQHEAKTDVVHVFDNILVWRSRSRVYAINLLSGQTVWKQNIVTNAGFNTDGVAGLGNRFLIHGWDPIYFSGYTYTGNITENPTLKPPFRTNHAETVLFLNSSRNFLSQASADDTLAVLPYDSPVGETATFFTIYNLTKNQEIYTKTIPGDTSGVFSRP